ncbi:hypothetical protein EYF80_046643 [Liparis tanakae]|uniref:Uncharacterized protein n=1 Tax=Liparis tanakae TaxID=230148 RepID=A0A4Z2FPS6_9TELE|nr:hypothetical protein EYF80_046643 [Liparis tanakae]
MKNEKDIGHVSRRKGAQRRGIKHPRAEHIEHIEHIEHVEHVEHILSGWRAGRASGREGGLGNQTGGFPERNTHLQRSEARWTFFVRKHLLYNLRTSTLFHRGGIRHLDCVQKTEETERRATANFGSRV